MTTSALAAWHRVVETRDASLLDALLADDATFHSPIVHTPQAGKAKTAMYLRAALAILGGPSFHYVREVEAGRDCVLEFVTACPRCRSARRRC